MFEYSKTAAKAYFKLANEAGQLASKTDFDDIFDALIEISTEANVKIFVMCGWRKDRLKTMCRDCDISLDQYECLEHQLVILND